jgi:hypothetical protein
MGKNVFGGIYDFVLIYEENWNGGIWIGGFLVFCSEIHVVQVRRGDHLLFWGICVKVLCEWGDRRVGIKVT